MEIEWDLQPKCVKLPRGTGRRSARRGWWGVNHRRQILCLLLREWLTETEMANLKSELLCCEQHISKSGISLVAGGGRGEKQTGLLFWIKTPGSQLLLGELIWPGECHISTFRAQNALSGNFYWFLWQMKYCRVWTQMLFLFSRDITKFCIILGRQLLQGDWRSLLNVDVGLMVNLIYESFRVKIFLFEQSKPRWIILNAHQIVLLLFWDFYDQGTGDIQWFQCTIQASVLWHLCPKCWLRALPCIFSWSPSGNRLLEVLLSERIRFDNLHMMHTMHIPWPCTHHSAWALVPLPHTVPFLCSP